MQETHARVTKAVGTATGKAFVNVEADDIRELAASVKEPSETVKALLSGTTKCKPGINVWQQAQDIRELLIAVPVSQIKAPTPASSGS